MGRTIVVNDSYQKNYRYEITEPVGRNFHPEFKPELTPKEMLRIGVFGGKYMSDKPKEFPDSWYVKAKLSLDGEKHCEINFFKKCVSQPLKVWQEKGWIYPDDPRGWFQWYCRYYMGRRMEDDERQIKRWKAFKRHAIQVKKNCKAGDLGCRQKQRQALLHWAYDSRRI
ncbi:hypothetical protein KKH05_01165 [Patescibacteria group bacterium]|nr:hypothetical protein [Patescibacteria group bacterium]